MEIAKQEGRRARRTVIIDLAAYLGRYAHQPISETLSLTLSDMLELASATGAILEEEARASKG